MSLVLRGERGNEGLHIATTEYRVKCGIMCKIRLDELDRVNDSLPHNVWEA